MMLFLFNVQLRNKYDDDDDEIIPSRLMPTAYSVPFGRLNYGLTAGCIFDCPWSPMIGKI